VLGRLGRRLAQERQEVGLELGARGGVDVEHVAGLVVGEVEVGPDGRVELHRRHHVLGAEERASRGRSSRR
jgi:hypothetical protein